MFGRVGRDAERQHHVGSARTTKSIKQGRKVSQPTVLSCLSCLVSRLCVCLLYAGVSVCLEENPPTPPTSLPISVCSSTLHSGHSHTYNDGWSCLPALCNQCRAVRDVRAARMTASKLQTNSLSQSVSHSVSHVRCATSLAHPTTELTPLTRNGFPLVPSR